MRYVLLLAAILLAACGQAAHDNRALAPTKPESPTPSPVQPTLTPVSPTPTQVPTPTLIPHPTLAPPLTWDAIDAELADPSSTWRKEHLFRVFANALRDHDGELKKYDNTILTIEGPYSHRTEDHAIHLQWSYSGHTFTINCGISPRPNAEQLAYLDSIRQHTPAMIVRGEFLYKPGQLPGFGYIEKNTGGAFDVHLDLVYKYCQILTVDGQPWPPTP